MTPPPTKRRALAATGCVVAILLAAVGARALQVVLQSRQGPGPLAVRWEGAVNDRNARDLGASLDACLGEPRFRAGVVTRAAQWFSGWSCAGIGDPDVILSLNYKPGQTERYYCRADGANRVGLVSGAAEELNDIEFTATWDDPVQRDAACWYLRQAVDALAAGKRLLVHCDAGRDRTGTFAALLAAVAAESAGGLDERMLDAIECDYRKSESLVPDKYGRMRKFLGQLRETGGATALLTRTCGIAPAEVAAASAALLAPPPSPDLSKEAL
jgi:hypothetical protein